jgi:hypothetical protein
MGKKLLIGLAGRAGVGKDTAAKYLCDEFTMRQYALASPIKDALSAMGFHRGLYDRDDVKDQPIAGLGVSYRKLAQTLGTEWGRAIHPEFWLILGSREWHALSPDFRGMVISDVRFENEAALVRDAGGIVIHIAGPSRRPIAIDGAVHASEGGVERVQDDVVVTNTGSLTFFFGQLHSVVAHALSAPR